MARSDRKATIKLLIIPLMISIVVTAIATVSFYYYELDNRKALKRTALAQSAITLSEKLDQSFTDVNFALIESAQGGQPCQSNHTGLSQQLLLKLPHISELRYTDANNQTLCNNWQQFSPSLSSHTPLLHKGLNFFGPHLIEDRAEPIYQLFRRHQDGGQVQAVLHRVWLKNQVKFFHSPLGFMAIINSDSGVPVVINGKYSMPLNADPTFPINESVSFEGMLDNGRMHYTFIQPLTTQPTLSVAISQDLDSLYAGIYGFNASWIGTAGAGVTLLFLLCFQLQRKLNDPIRQLRSAIRRREFFNLYQPLVRSSDHRIIGCEVLMRWHHPFKGVLPPMTFIPLAERSELIKEMTLQQIDTVIRELAPVLRLTPTFKVSVNICAAHINDPAVIDAIIARAPKLKGLVLEITEHQVVEHSSPKIQQALHRLRDAGIKISMDDFGTGYCGLSYLSSLPIDVLKADRSFVAALGTDSINADVLKTILQLAQKLGMEAIAEGVEKHEQAKMLSQMGFDVQQGWLHGYPVSAFEFVEQYLQQRPEQRKPLPIAKPVTESVTPA